MPGGVEQFGVHRRRLRADAIHFGAVGVVPLVLRDVMAIDAGHHGAFAREVAAVDANKDKRRNDQQEQQEHHDLGVLADGFEHVRSFSGDKEKANSRSPFCSVVGADGVEPPTYAL